MLSLSVRFPLMVGLLVAALAVPQIVQAIPAFARQTEMSCTSCHAAVPKLNSFGENFAANGYRLPNWKDKRESYGDDRLNLPDTIPLAIRMQGFAQLRSADRASENEKAANADLQSPYFIKLLSGAPLTDHINAYFYGIFAEKGENSEVLIEDAWLRHDDVFGTGIEATLGQFQVSDLMFPREVRLPFQDYIPYRMAGITYERGLLLERGVGPIDLGLGFVNGNGIKESRNLTASGFNRSDRSFDNDDRKAVFGRIGTDIAGVGVGLFGYSGAQPNGFQQEATNINGGIPDHEASKDIVGLDLSGKFNSNVYWHAQGLYNRWDDFLENGEDYSWSGAFAGVDWIPSQKWAFSMLYNYADANDLDRVRLSDFASISAGDVDGTFANNRYDGLNLNTITFTSSYYFASNVRGVIEANGDLQSTNDFGHGEAEHYLLFGLDAAY